MDKLTMLLIGAAGIGWMLPEFFMCISPRKIYFPTLCNVITAVSCAFIAYFFFG